MYNVIFYGDIKEKTLTQDYIEREYTDDQGNYTDTIRTEEVVKKYRVPTKFVFETATNCDRLLFKYDVLDDFKADMRSLNSAESMLEGSSITSFSGANGGVADFKSLTNANDMFRDCQKLVSIDIDASALQTVEGFVLGCTALESFSGSLSSLIDGTDMFSGLENFKSFSADLTSLKDATDMFSGTSLSSFTVDLPSLTTGTRMFYGTPLEIVEVNAPELLYGDDMFGECTQLAEITFNTPLLKNADRMMVGTVVITISLDAPELESADGMFEDVRSLTSFSGDLSNLRNGNAMFKNTSLESFEVQSLDNLVTADEMMVGTQITEWNLELPNLESADGMFTAYVEEVEGEEEPLTINPALVSFEGDLSALKNGDNMFRDCVNLEHFDAPLSSLESGIDMFTNCKLDSQSLMYILGTLPTPPEGESRNITIGVNCNGLTLLDFLTEHGIYTDYDDLYLRTYYNGWNLTLVGNQPSE